METVVPMQPESALQGDFRHPDTGGLYESRGLLPRDPFLRNTLPVGDAVIMIVDDDPINIRVVEKHLRSAGYRHFLTTTEPETVLDRIRFQIPDVVVLDVVMPHVSGLDILKVVRGDAGLQHLPVIILSAAGDEVTRLEALEAGATDFLTKPVLAAELVTRIRNMLIVKAHFDHLADYSAKLEHEVRLRTDELAQAREELVHVLACAAEHRDHETGNHVLRVGRIAGILARQLGLSDSRAELIEQAAILHDVGKIGIPDAILLKRGRLTPDEIQTMRNHCVFGRNILHALPSNGLLNPGLTNHWGSRSPMLQLAATIAISHHERWDGAGYPRGLVGQAIPVEGRITAVADVFDALHSERQYKSALPLDECFRLLEEGRGRHFDPRVLDAFFARQDEIIQVTVELAN